MAVAGHPKGVGISPKWSGEVPFRRPLLGSLLPDPYIIIFPVH